MFVKVFVLTDSGAGNNITLGPLSAPPAVPVNHPFLPAFFRKHTDELHTSDGQAPCVRLPVILPWTPAASHRPLAP